MVGKIIKYLILIALIYLVYHIMGGAPVEKKFLKALENRGLAREFEDSFENASKFEELFPSNGSRWNSINLRSPEEGRFATSTKYCMTDWLLCDQNTSGNYLEISKNTKKRGNQSLKIVAQPSDLESGKVSRASIRKHGLNFENGDTVTMSFWVKLEGNSNNITAKDLIFAGLREQKRPFKNRREAGRFLFLSDKEAVASDIFFHLPKPEPMTQPLLDKIPFPKNRWVRVESEIILSDQESGRVRVWQDGQAVLTRNGKTMPDGDTVYNIFEVGIIGHDSKAYQQIMYLDDVKIRLGKR